MHFTTFLKKHFDIEKVVGTSDSGNDTESIYVYEKGNDIYVMNFHPNRSFRGYFIPVTEPGEYKVILSTDEKQFGGQERVSKTYVYKTEELPDGRCGFLLYTPSRTAIVLKKMKGKSSKK